MRDIELMVAAMENTEQAQQILFRAADLGQAVPVPVILFTQAMVHLRQASSAIIELERRARGGQPAEVGEKELLSEI